jgi:acyl-CoA reductase-like NAD-dependent aldehyde dehydrogenase
VSRTKTTTETRGAPAAAFRDSGSLFIDGRSVAGEGDVLRIINPATEEQIAQIHGASGEQVDQAVAAARRAFDHGPWPWCAPDERASAINRLAERVEAHRDELVAAIVDEVGSPVTLARGLQVDTVPVHLREFASLAATPLEDDLGVDPGPPASRSIVGYRPAGVVAAISAYNYPLLLAMVKVGAALAAGCTVVLLVPDRSVMNGLMIGELVREADLPDGVVNVIAGGPDIGVRLTSRGDVDRVSFTGSMAVGRAVMKQASSFVTNVVMELGGKSANIIMPGMTLDERTVKPMHLRYLRNAGQGCASPTRFLVPESDYDRFLDVSRAVYGTIGVGDPWNEETVVGPVISQRHRAVVEGFVDRAVRSGATIVAGGGRADPPRGWYVNPTLIGNVERDAEIVQEEIFGPVAVVLPYRDISEAIESANDTKYGLAAHVQAADVEDAVAIAPRLRAGSVYINGGGALRANAPFGGFKASGLGREWGSHGVREYLEAQHIQWVVRTPVA